MITESKWRALEPKTLLVRPGDEAIASAPTFKYILQYSSPCLKAKVKTFQEAAGKS